MTTAQEIVREYKMNVPLHMLANKYRVKPHDIINMLHKLVKPNIKDMK